MLIVIKIFMQGIKLMSEIPNKYQINNLIIIMIPSAMFSVEPIPPSEAGDADNGAESVV